MIEWIVQDIFGDETEDLLRALTNQGIKYYLVKENQHFSYNQQYIIRGSLEFVNEQQKENINLLYFHLKNFNCSRYYHRFKNLMFNNDHFFVTKAGLKLSKNILPWSQIPPTQRVFIRPDSGGKEFTGTYICKKWFEKDIDIVLKNTSMLDSDLILVSTYKDSVEEFRGVVLNGKLISVSKESFNGVKISSKFYKQILEFAKSFVFPNISFCYTVDFCEVDGKIRIVEANSFNCAGLYNVNYDKIVKEISNVFIS